GNGHCADRTGPLIRGPEADKRSEREREEHPVARADPSASVDVAPAARPPIPGLVGIEPTDGRLAGRARRLMQPGVALDRITEVRAKRRTQGLVFGELLLGGEGQLREGIPRIQPAASAKLAGIERDGGQDLLE